MSSSALPFAPPSMSRWKLSKPISISGSSSTTPSARIRASATWANAPSRPSCYTWSMFAKKVKDTHDIPGVTQLVLSWRWNKYTVNTTNPITQHTNTISENIWLSTMTLSDGYPSPSGVSPLNQINRLFKL
jgi:hypothetical protein